MSNEPQKPATQNQPAEPSTLLTHMDREHFRKHIRLAIGIFVALIVLTAVTVRASYWDLGHMGNIVLALIIATIKAGMVAAVFMHLMGERSMIFRVLAFTFIFFAGLFALILGAFSDLVKLVK